MRDSSLMKNLKKVKVDRIKTFYLATLGSAFIIFLILASLNFLVKREISSLQVFLNPLNFKAEDYPVINNNLVPEISAQGAIVIDKASQVPIFEKNSHLRFPPASTTKIMTALVALDHYKPDDILSIKTATVEGSIIGFSENEKFKFQELFYAMLLPSANDATLAIAQNYPGGEKEFIREMNRKAKEYHLLNTHYADPIGLEDDRDYTTSLDLARLAVIALNNADFSKAVSTKNLQIESREGNKYLLYNLNKLLDLPGISGVKTGFTEAAGQVLVTSKKIKNTNQEIIIVVMQSQDRFLDTEILLNYLSGLNYQPIRP